MQMSRRDAVAFGSAFIATMLPLIRQSAEGATFITRRPYGAIEQHRMWYRYAIYLMRQITPTNPLSDPYSWAYWAENHRRFCQHYSFLFEGYHILYLMGQEAILRLILVRDGGVSASQLGDFGMPCLNTSQNALIHEDFRDPDTSVYYPGLSNAFMSGQSVPNSARLLAANAWGLPYSAAAGTPSFGGAAISQQSHRGPFAGSMEAMHNAFHNWVGGAFADPDTAADLGIFGPWHAWAEAFYLAYVANGGARPTSSSWRNQAFPIFFPNRTGSISIADSIGFQTANVRYSTLPTIPESAKRSALKAQVATTKAVPLGTRHLASTGLRTLVNNRTPIVITLGGEAPNGTVLVEFKGVVFNRPSVYFEVYQVRDGQTEYLGNLASFGHAGHGMANDFSFYADVGTSRALRLLLVPQDNADLDAEKARAAVGKVATITVTG